MRVDIVIGQNAPHQATIGRAMAEGLARHGVRCAVVTAGSAAVTADIVCCWGWRQGQIHRARGRRVLLMERGYVDRMRWCSLGWDGLNGRARFPGCLDDGRRWHANFPGRLKWRDGDGFGYALVLGQVAGDAAVRGVRLESWYARAAARLGETTGLPVLFRPHPNVLRREQPRPAIQLHGLDVLCGSLDDALAGAAAVASYNSNSLTDAALAGVPLLAGDKGAMAWSIAGQGLDAEPALGDRIPWCYRLAWCQWLPEEIASGAAWDALRTVMEPATEVA